MARSISPIAKRYGLELVVLFGSQARGNAQMSSDVDLGILRTKPLTVRQELRLRHEFSDYFGKEIDLTHLNTAPPLLLGRVAKEGKCLYGSRKRFVSFMVYAMQRFIDFKPYFDLEEKTLKKRLTRLHSS